MFKWLRRRPQKSQEKVEEGRSGGTGRLVAPDSTSQPDSPEVIRSLLQAAIADAEQLAAGIETRAKTEAEAEAARVISQAELEVQEMRERAEKAARQQAEDIIAEAKRKAEITETEAKQRAARFLIGVGEEVGKEISEEYRKAYSRLDSTLQGLVGEGQQIETEWQGKVAQLGQGKGFELKEYEAMLLGTVETIVPTTAAPTAAETQLETDTSEAESIQLWEEAEKTEVAKKASKVQKQAEKEAKLAAKEEAKREAEAAKKASKAQKQAEKEAKLAVGKEVTVAAPSEGVAIEEGVAAVALPEEEVVEGKVEEAPPFEETAVGKEITAAVPPVLDSKTPYTGEVELIITSPTELRLVSRLYNYLQTVPELRILYTRGSWDQGTTIVVVLDKPMPLIGILSQTPGVKTTLELAGKDNASVGRVGPLLRGREQVRRIKLNLREA